MGRTRITVISNIKIEDSSNELPDRDLSVAAVARRPRRRRQKAGQGFSGHRAGNIIPPEYETRIAIIKKKSELYDINIDDEAADFIASNIKNNVREIEGALNTLKISHEFIGNGVIDLKFTKNILKDIIKKKPTEIEDIIKTVSATTKVKPSDIVSKKRTKGISISRQIAIYLSRKYTSKTFKEIGEKFGGRDHSTIITSISNIEKLILDDEQIAKLVNKLSKDIETSKGNL